MNNIRQKLSLPTRPRLSAKEKTLFAKRMSFLIKAGVPVVESLEMLKKQSMSKGKVFLYSRLIADVSDGKFLSTSLSRFRGVFGDFAINIIRVGEQSGTLGANLHYLSEELKKKQLLRRKVVSAMTYPIIITLATIGLASMLTLYIFPKILPIFRSLHVKLPATTRFLIWLSDLLRGNSLLVLLGALVAASGLFVLVKNVPRVKSILEHVLLRLPIIGTIVKTYNLSNITRTLGLLLKSGTPVLEAIATTADTTANSVYREELLEVVAIVKTGQKISRRLQERPQLFPNVCSELVAVGERSGNLSETLLYISEMYEHELDEAVRGLSSAIEPALMIIMGLVVGFVAVSIITPIYQITQTLGH